MVLYPANTSAITLINTGSSKAKSKTYDEDYLPFRFTGYPVHCSPCSTCSVCGEKFGNQAVKRLQSKHAHMSGKRLSI